MKVNKSNNFYEASWNVIWTSTWRWSIYKATIGDRLWWSINFRYGSFDSNFSSDELQIQYHSWQDNDQILFQIDKLIEKVIWYAID